MSKVENVASTNVSKPAREAGNFVSKAHDMIESCHISNPEVAGWNSSGETIIIYSSTQLEQVYLPRYFQHNKFQSFVRQLNLYGFKNVTKEIAALDDNSGCNSSSGNGGLQAFRHPQFLMGRKDLVSNIQRSKSGDRAQRKARQDEALHELSGRLDSMESDVKSLDRKVDAVSEKLDVVIAMLSAAGFSAPSTDVNGAARQLPPPYNAHNEAAGNNPRGSSAVSGWLDSVAVAGQKRNRSGRGSGGGGANKANTSRHVRTRPDEGKKFISSEGSMSESDDEKNKGATYKNKGATGQHMFYDTLSGERVKSPLDDDPRPAPQTYDPSYDDDLELDAQTQNVLMTLNEERAIEDPELGTRSMQLDGITEPIPLDSSFELPDIILADDRPPGQSARDGGMNTAAVGDGQDQRGGMRKFVGKNRNFVIAGLLVTCVVAAAIGAGLTTSQRNGPPTAPALSDASYSEPALEDATPAVSLEENTDETEGVEMADMETDGADSIIPPPPMEMEMDEERVASPTETSVVMVPPAEPQISIVPADGGNEDSSANEMREEDNAKGEDVQMVQTEQDPPRTKEKVSSVAALAPTEEERGEVFSIPEEKDEDRSFGGGGSAPDTVENDPPWSIPPNAQVGAESVRLATAMPTSTPTAEPTAMPSFEKTIAL